MRLGRVHQRTLEFGINSEQYIIKRRRKTKGFNWLNMQVIIDKYAAWWIVTDRLLAELK